MDKLAEEIRELDRSPDRHQGKLLSAEGVSRMASQRRKNRSMALAVSISLVVCGAFGITIFTKQFRAPVTKGMNEEQIRLAVSIELMEQELNQAVTLRHQTEQLLAELQQSSTIESDWNTPIEDASMATFSCAKKMLERGVPSDDVQQQLSKLQQSFPGTFGAMRAEELAAELAATNRLPELERKPSSQNRRAFSAWNQIAKDF